MMQLRLFLQKKDSVSVPTSFRTSLVKTTFTATDEADPPRPSTSASSISSCQTARHLKPQSSPIQRQPSSKQPVALLVCPIGERQTIQLPNCYLVMEDAEKKKSSTSVGWDMNLSWIDNASSMPRPFETEEVDETEEKDKVDQQRKCLQTSSISQNFELLGDSLVKQVRPTLIPEGLRCLRSLDRVFIHQKLELLEGNEIQACFVR